jgi:hypothetical protein
MLSFFLACSLSGDSRSGDTVTGDDSDTEAAKYTCAPVIQADGKSTSGVEYCFLDEFELGYVNRTSAEACTGDPRATVPECRHGDEGSCAKDTDCAAGQVCGGGTDGPYCRCYTVCGSDADCGVDQTCLCALQEISVHEGGGAYSPGFIDQCLPSDCRTGADCASGECGAAPNICGQGGPAIGLYCRTAADECHSNDDCAPPTPVCTYDGKSRWACFEGATCE